MDSTQMKIYVSKDNAKLVNPEFIHVSDIGKAALLIFESQKSVVSDVDNYLVKLAPGTYHEKVEFIGDNITLIGEDPENTIIEFNDYALYIMPDEGRKRGTFRSYTMFVDGDNFSMKNVTVANTAGYGAKIGQAVAMYMDGDNAEFENCRFLGRQDTLFTAPLPPSVIEAGGFRGPKEFAPRKNQSHHYKNCYIEGDVDFIFGGATAYFDGCEIKSLCRDASATDAVQGYITAASTPEEIKTGYVFTNCRFTSDCPPQSVYLGRPWRIYARVRIENCELGAHIKPEGWFDWGKEEAQTTTHYIEENNYGPGANLSGRVSWMKKE